MQLPAVWLLTCHNLAKVGMESQSHFGSTNSMVWASRRAPFCWRKIKHQKLIKGDEWNFVGAFCVYLILEEEIRTAGWNRNDEWLLVEETKWNSVLQVTLVLFVPKFGFWDLYFDKVHQTSRSFFVATHEICTAEAAHQGIEYKCEICPKAQPICVSAMPWFAMIGPPWHSKLGGG